MLVLSRRLGEAIVVGSQIVVKVVSIHGSSVKLGIEAPLEIAIRRVAPETSVAAWKTATTAESP